MNEQRINELIELLHSGWKKQPNLSLLQFLSQRTTASGFKDKLEDLSDDALIYELKMREIASSDAIPGVKKDHEEDFKTALLRARNVIND